MPKLIIQLHIHSNKSSDSKISITDYIQYFESILSTKEYGILGITDHNIIPINSEEALRLSTDRVLVIPGIQWSLYKTLWDSLSKLCTRKNLITIGVHDDLEKFLSLKTQYKLSARKEILQHIKVEDLLDYIAQNKEIILIIPHPKHFFIEFYGKKEIQELEEKLRKKSISMPLFIEEKSGYDPFP